MVVMSELKKDILRTRRGYFIDKVKKPLMKALVLIGNRYLEPTKESTEKQSSHVFIDIFDEFFKRETNDGRKPLFHAIKRIFIGENEHDEYEAQRIDWFGFEVFKAYMDGRLQPPPDWSPMLYWDDPATDGARMQELRRRFANLGVERKVK